MKKARLALIILAIIILIKCSISIDYNDLSWSNNKGDYKLIGAMIGVILSMSLLTESYKGEDF